MMVKFADRFEVANERVDRNENQDRKNETKAEAKPDIGRGELIFFYAFDIGDEIDPQDIREQNLVPLLPERASPFFRYHTAPLSYRLPGWKDRDDIVLARIHSFGVLSIAYRVPVSGTFEQIKRLVIKHKEEFDYTSQEDVKDSFEKLIPAIRSPNFFNLRNEYYVVQVSPQKSRIGGAGDLRQRYSSQIAQVLRLEHRLLSKYQVEDIFSTSTGYYGRELVVIDGEAAFVYDDEYYELIELFESTCVQELELKYFDRLLDSRLTKFYMQENANPPLLAYVPIIGRRFEPQISRLARLRVDISVITERVESSINVVGDAYFSQIYSMLVKKLMLRSIREAINRKLDIIWDMYTVHRDSLDAMHEEIMTAVIIVLIALELLVI